MPGTFPVLTSGVAFKYPVTRAARLRTKVHRFIDLSEQRYAQGAVGLTDFVFVFNSISTVDKETIRGFYGAQNGEAATDWTLLFDGVLYIGCQFIGPFRADYVNVNLWNVTLPVRTVQSTSLGATIMGTVELGMGLPISATLNILSSHVQGGGPGVIFANNIVSIFDRGWGGGGGNWTLRTDSIAVNPAIIYSGLVEFATFTTQFPGPCIPPEVLLVYDVWIQATFPGGVIQNLRPLSYLVENVVADGYGGTVDNPQNATDNDPTTFATLTKMSATTIDFFPVLRLSNFR